MHRNPACLPENDDYNWDAWQALGHSIRSGETAFDHAFGQPVFEYLRAHSAKDKDFSQAMASISASENAAVARAFDFGRFRRLVDVGGAHGHLLAAILRRHRKLRGVLYDQPQVVAGAAESGFVTAPGIASRCEIVSGSFFDSLPPGADAYLLKFIIHDWDDEKALRILRNCRAAMDPKGSVLLIEHVIAPGNAPDWGKLLDLNMLVIPGGQERTREEFRALFARAGLRLARVHRTQGPLSLLEAEVD